MSRERVASVLAGVLIAPVMVPVTLLGWLLRQMQGDQE
jgi:hypothetical protein